MRARIHRGAAEVGGNCVELESRDGARLLLDLGRPLWAGADDVVPLPDVSGLDGSRSDLVGVVISHPHLDHYGLLADVPSSVPVYMGEAAARIVEAARFFSPATPKIFPTGYLAHRRTFQLGPFSIEPRLNDHSAFDSYSLVVEADGRRLYYTGDIRGHGRKAALFDELLEEPPAGVDVMVMEGTHITSDQERVRPVSACASEVEVEDRLVDLCGSTTGLIVVCGSAQNLDRIVSVHRAALRSDRSTVLDLYGATVAQATRSSIPQPGHRGLRVFVPQRQRVLVKEAREFHRVQGVTEVRIFPEELVAEPGRYLLHVPSSTVAELVRSGALDARGAVVWSLWDGYLMQPSGQRLRTALDKAGVEMVSIHTSGHAGPVDLQRLVRAVNPGRVVPIHCDDPAAYATMFSQVEVYEDGAWWTV